MANNKHWVPAWIIVAIILSSLTLWALSRPIQAAGDYALVEPSKTTGSTLAGAPINASVPYSNVPRPSLPSTLDNSPQITPTVTYTSFLPLVYARHWMSPESSFGVQILWLDPTTASKITEVGASWVRVPLRWAGIEPANTTPENYQWSAAFDQGLAQLSSSNVRTILTLAINPSWWATYWGGPPIDPGEMHELVEFMVAAVERYSAPPYNVKYWEFYNEPDNGSEYYAEYGFGFFGNQPEVYAQMLAAVYQPMKAADPEAQILMGGLAYDNWASDGGPFVENFLDGVLQYIVQHGGSGYFDVMNFHYYQAFRTRWENPPFGILGIPGFIGKATYLQQKLVSYGLHKPIICTESSQVSDALHGGSDELQSRYIVQLFTWAMASDVDPTIWFMLTDEAGLAGYKYGLFDSGLNPKPSYSAFDTLVKQLSPADYVRTLSSAETGSDKIAAFEFLDEVGSTRIIVAWTTSGSSLQMRLRTNRVVVVNKYGGETTIYDQGDGVVDGYVWVTLGPSPVYLRMAQ